MALVIDSILDNGNGATCFVMVRSIDTVDILGETITQKSKQYASLEIPVASKDAFEDKVGEPLVGYRMSPFDNVDSSRDINKFKLVKTN